MATPSRMRTRSKNATTHPALPVLQLNEELDSDRKAERASRKKKATDKKKQNELVLAKKLASLEQGIAHDDAIDDTPRPVQPKAQKATASKLRHTGVDHTTSGSEVSGAEEPPIPCLFGEDESSAHTTEDKQYSEQEWTDSKVSTDDDEDQGEDSHNDVPRAKKMSQATKKRLAHTGKKSTKPLQVDQEQEIGDGDGDDGFVDATPLPKRRSNVGRKAMTKAAGNTKRRQDKLNGEEAVGLPIVMKHTQDTVNDDDCTPKANKGGKRRLRRLDPSSDGEACATVTNKRPREMPEEVDAEPMDGELDDIHNSGNATRGPTRQGERAHTNRTRQSGSGNGKTNQSGSREPISGGHESSGTLQGTTRMTSGKGANLSHREASRARSDDPLDDVADWAAKVPTKGLGRTRTSTAPTPSLAGASERTQSSTVAKSSNNSIVRGNVGVRVAEGGEGKAGGLDEADRKESEEACGGGNVPAKRKGRDSSSAQESNKKARKRARNENMPREALLNNAWRNKVIPTLFQWAGTQREPFALGDFNIRDALLTIGRAVYGDLDLGLDDVEEDIPGKHPSYTRSDAFQIAQQRLSEWRNGFSSAAISVVVAFFEDEHNRHRYATDQDRKTFAIGQLRENRFMYKNSNDEDENSFSGRFRGPLLIQTFASHINATSGAVQAPGLYPDNKQPPPRGSLGLAAAAMERVLKIIIDGAITIASIEDDRAHNRKIKPVAQTNPGSGKESTHSFAFSSVAWGKATCAWGKAALKYYAENPNKIKKLFDEARVFQRAAFRRLPAGESESDDGGRVLLSGAVSSDDDEYYQLMPLPQFPKIP